MLVLHILLAIISLHIHLLHVMVAFHLLLAIVARQDTMISLLAMLPCNQDGMVTLIPVYLLDRVACNHALLDKFALLHGCMVGVHHDSLLVFVRFLSSPIGSFRCL
jgi:hypothetical protein